jgi:small subunit ribosomal protein S18
MKKKQRKKQVRFRKNCVFCKKNLDINYKNIDLLSRFITSKKKIASRRSSGNCAKHQRRLAQAIKRARYLALLPYAPR